MFVSDSLRVPSATYFTQIDTHLPSHIVAVQNSGHPVAWICDPMHGKYDLWLPVHH